MKQIVIFLLLTLVLTETPQCKQNEIVDQTTQTCIQICEENEYYNADSNSCEQCKDGEFYNQESKQCEYPCHEGEKYNPQTNSCDPIETQPIQDQPTQHIQDQPT